MYVQRDKLWTLPTIFYVVSNYISFLHWFQNLNYVVNCPPGSFQTEGERVVLVDGVNVTESIPVCTACGNNEVQPEQARLHVYLVQQATPTCENV